MGPSPWKYFEIRNSADMCSILTENQGFQPAMTGIQDPAIQPYQGYAL